MGRIGITKIYEGGSERFMGVEVLELLNERNNLERAALDDAIAIAAMVHKGQTDMAGNSCILHPL